MMDRLRRFGAMAWRVLAGAVVCQFVLTSVLAVGWTYRFMRRTAVRRWYSRSDAAKSGESFAAFASQHDDFEAYSAAPRWVWAQTRRTPETVRDRARGWFGSLALNARVGAQGLFNTAVLTVVPALLWYLGWYSGWDNSFNKGYEQYYVGITLCMTGNVLFILAMLYLPMAQARQAATGDWRAFYRFAAVWRVVQQKRVACLVVAGLYSLVSIPVTLTKTLPWAMGMNEAFADSSAVELVQFLNRFYFFACAFGFVAYVFLHAFTARVYADGVVQALASGRLEPRQLHPSERALFATLGLRAEPVEAALPAPIEFAKVTMSPGWRFTVALATLAVWFSFVAQIYVSEFVNYHPIRGWANQSLVQAPWFRYVPSGLKAAAASETAAHAETRENRAE